MTVRDADVIVGALRKLQTTLNKTESIGGSSKEKDIRFMAQELPNLPKSYLQKLN